VTVSFGEKDAGDRHFSSSPSSHFDNVVLVQVGVRYLTYSGLGSICCKRSWGCALPAGGKQGASVCPRGYSLEIAKSRESDLCVTTRHHPIVRKVERTPPDQGATIPGRSV
jgi:hypothetical protein